MRHLGVSLEKCRKATAPNLLGPEWHCLSAPLRIASVSRSTFDAGDDIVRNIPTLLHNTYEIDFLILYIAYHCDLEENTKSCNYIEFTYAVHNLHRCSDRLWAVEV